MEYNIFVASLCYSYKIYIKYTFETFNQTLQKKKEKKIT